MPTETPPWVLTSAPEPVAARPRPRIAPPFVFLLGLLLGIALDVAYLRTDGSFNDLLRRIGLQDPAPEEVAGVTDPLPVPASPPEADAAAPATPTVDAGPDGRRRSGPVKKRRR